MTKENKTSTSIWDNKTLIIAVVVVLVILVMYFHDQKQQRAYELRRLEKRVELLEEWGRPAQNRQSPYPRGGGAVTALIAKSYVQSGNQGRCFSC
jgi:hypothetical protein